jgi:hypothetical protein
MVGRFRGYVTTGEPIQLAIDMIAECIETDAVDPLNAPIT